MGVPLAHHKGNGNSGCGKTALIPHWTSSTFATPSQPTIASNHDRKRVDLHRTSPIDIDVQDTAGQVQFQALIPVYAQSSCSALVTTSVDDPPSFPQRHLQFRGRLQGRKSRR
jgi:GTPase SAR1 family protein